MIVFGTSLQVAPFCAIPNLAPRLRARAHLALDDCLANAWSRAPSRGHRVSTATAGPAIAASGRLPR